MTSHHEILERLRIVWGQMAGYFDPGARETEWVKIEQTEIRYWMDAIQMARHEIEKEGGR